MNKPLNVNGVEDASDGPKAASMLCGRLEATGKERSNGVENKNDAAMEMTAAYRPPRVELQPGANGINDKTASMWPHSVTMIDNIHK